MSNIHKQPIYASTYNNRHRLFWALGILAVIGVLLAGAWLWLNRNPRPDAKTYPVLGVMLDQTDGIQDFPTLQKNHVQFVYLKATEGASYFDDEFATNYDRVNGSGIRVGVYHFFSFDSTAEAQFNQFNRQVGSDLGDLPIGIYLEYYSQYTDTPPSKAQFQTRLEALIQLIHTRLGREVMLMGTPTILERAATISPKSPRWVVSDTAPKHATFWQYRDSATLPGDDSKKFYQPAVFNGSSAQFQAQSNKIVR